MNVDILNPRFLVMNWMDNGCLLLLLC